VVRYFRPVALTLLQTASLAMVGRSRPGVPPRRQPGAADARASDAMRM